MTASAVRAPALTREPGWYAMLLVIATEATVFALLLAAYFFLQFTHEGAWPPPPAEVPRLLTPVLMTVLLTGSSIPAYLADRGARRGRMERVGVLLGATAVLGIAFLVLQVVEYREKLDVFTPRTDAYGSAFYTVTGLHGAHVAFGVAALLFVLAFTALGRYSARRHLAIEVVTLYWHFVHVVWLFVFASLYLSPHL
ncbi:MAG: heme-copper oxidase subunit III [Thermoleophilia bacterium]|nr:heme-copper oxidase subunit III [Thermoleophilia bacterium]